MEKENEIDKKSDTSTTSFFPKKATIEEGMLATMLQIGKNGNASTESTAITLNSNNIQNLYSTFKEELKDEIKSDLINIIKDVLLKNKKDFKELFKTEQLDELLMDNSDEFSEPKFQKVTEEDYELFDKMKEKDYSKFKVLEYPEDEE